MVQTISHTRSNVYNLQPANQRANKLKGLRFHSAPQNKRVGKNFAVLNAPPTTTSNASNTNTSNTPLIAQPQTTDSITNDSFASNGDEEKSIWKWVLGALALIGGLALGAFLLRNKSGGDKPFKSSQTNEVPDVLNPVNPQGEAQINPPKKTAEEIAEDRWSNLKTIGGFSSFEEAVENEFLNHMVTKNGRGQSLQILMRKLSKIPEEIQKNHKVEITLRRSSTQTEDPLLKDETKNISLEELKQQIETLKEKFILTVVRSLACQEETAQLFFCPISGLWGNNGDYISLEKAFETAIKNNQFSKKDFFEIYDLIFLLDSYSDKNVLDQVNALQTT